MILSENSSEPPVGGADLSAPGRVWYTPAEPSPSAADGPLPARLLRLLEAKAWIALWQHDGRWKRLQAGYARLAPRQEELELDRAWAADQATDGGAVINHVRKVPARRKDIARVPPAAEDALRCPDCGATGPIRGRVGRKFRIASDLAQHRQWCAHPPSELLRCPDCGATHGKRGKKFRLPEDLLQHRKWCVLRLPKAAGAAASSPRGGDAAETTGGEDATATTRA